MSKFKYRAKKISGEMITGELEATNKNAAYTGLQKQGFFPTFLEEVNDQTNGLRSLITVSKGIRKNDIGHFTRGLADLLNSGVSLARALTILKNQVPHNKPLLELIDWVYQDIIRGNTFSDALAKHPKVFSAFYCNMVYSGEASGTLSSVLNELDQIFERDEEIRVKIQSAMAYPIVMAIVGIGTIWILMAFVIPRITHMFADMGQPLPILTRVLAAISAIASQWWFVFLIGGIVGLGLFLQFYRTKPGKLLVDRIKLSIPLLKEIELKSEVSRFTRTLASMMHSGIPILTAIKIVSDILSNQVIANEISAIQAELKEGESLSNALKHCKTIPLAVKSVVAVGEESGNLESALKRTGEIYNKEVDRTIKVMTSLMEPLMILVMGLIVGFIVIAMMLPIFDIKITG